jgi:hypothetical protein
MRIKLAQAESDKIELMRDMGTYEAAVSDNVKMGSTFSKLYEIAKKTKRTLHSLEINSDRFIDDLFR